MILKIRLKNFRQHKDTTIVLPRRGTIGLIGANATGKSTIIEALAWAFYGAKATRGTKRSIRWARAPVRQVAEVEIDFEHAGHTYRIVRKETSAELYENGSEIPRAAGTDTVSAEIAAILGMSLEEFITTYFCTQQDLARIGRMGGTERTQFILRVMQVDQIDSGIEEARARRNALGAEKRGLLSGIGEREPLEVELAAAGETLVRAEAQDGQAQANAEQARKDESETAAVRGQMDTDRLAYERHRDREERAVERTVEIDAEILALDQRTERAAESRARIEEARPRLAKLPELRSERDRLLAAETQAERRTALEAEARETAAAIARLRERERAVAARLEVHDSGALARAEEAARSATEKARALLQDRETAHAIALAAGKSAANRIEKAKRKISALREQGPSGRCPTCQRALGAQFETAIADIENELAEAQAERNRQLVAYTATREPSPKERAAGEAASVADKTLRAARTANEEAERLRERLKNARKSLEEKDAEAARQQKEKAALAAVHPNPERREEVEAEIEALQSLEQQIAIDQANVAQAEELATRRQELAQRRQTQEAQAKAAREALAKLSFDAEHFEAAAAAHEAARAEARCKEQAHARTQAEVTAANQRLERADRALLDYDGKAERMHAITKHIKLLDETLEALIAFRTEQVEAIRPELEERTAHYVHVLTDGRYPDITMDESFGVRLIDGDAEMEVISGGSEDIAALATRLALGEMIAERSGKPLTLLVLDEPFASLSHEWRANVLSLIDHLKDRFEQTILITHHTEVRDAVDQPFAVEYDQADGYSRLAA